MMLEISSWGGNTLFPTRPTPVSAHNCCGFYLVPKDSFHTYNPGVMYTIGTNDMFSEYPKTKEDAITSMQPCWVEKTVLDEENTLFIKMNV